MITIIFGAPGAGKSSLSTFFLKKLYEEHGHELLEKSKKHIDKANDTRIHKLSYPDRPPIFSDFKVKFLVDYEKYFEPYFINGFYTGLANEHISIQFIPPGSKIFLSEVQRYYNSRKSQSMPDFVSRGYEIHRHYDLDFWLDVQRPSLVDLNIKAISKKLIEVQDMENTKNSADVVTRSVWHCREFENWLACEQYLATGEKTYKETAYVNEGNIFDCFDSFNYFSEFLPPEGEDFKFLPFRSRFVAEVCSDKIYYDFSEPKGFRSKSG